MKVINNFGSIISAVWKTFKIQMSTWEFATFPHLFPAAVSGRSPMLSLVEACDDALPEPKLINRLPSWCVIRAKSNNLCQIII